MTGNLHNGLIAIVFLCLLLSASGCTSNSAPAPVSPSISLQPGQDTVTVQPAAPGSEKKTLVVGIDGEYIPFSYLDSSGSPTGFDVDSMRWIARKKGLDVRFQPTAWDGIIPSLQTGKVDLIYSGMTITPERSEQVSFSTPYWEVNQEVVIRNDSEITLEDVQAGRAGIGAQRGSTAAGWVEKNLITANTMPRDRLKLYANTPLALDDLVAGKVDAVIFDDNVLRTMITGKPVRIAGNISTREEFGVAVRKSDPELLATMNDGLEQLKADPYWQELITKYRMK
jgi:polar amino acid transport system substrate-binding protein